MATSRVFAVASGKGGVGKTTCAVNLGAAFAEAGRSVAVVDVDLGMANLRDVLDVDEDAPTLHDVLSEDADLDSAIRPAPGDFDAIAGSSGLDAFGRAEPSGLREIVADLRERYDVVVLDTGGGLSYDTTLPIGLADSVILVTTPDDASLTNAETTNGIVERLEAELEGVIVNRMGGAAGESSSAIEARLDASVLGSVPEDSAVADSVTAGIPVVADDRTSPAAQSFREIAYGILEEPLPVDWADRDETSAPVQTVDPDEPTDDAAGATADSDAASDWADETEESDSDIVEAPSTTPNAERDAAETDDDGSEVASESSNESGGPGIADAIESAESGEATGESPAYLGAGESEDDTESTESKSLLSRITGGLFG